MRPPSEERGPTRVAQNLSLQSRLSNLLAIALMLIFGAGVLAWYYTHMAMRPPRTRQANTAGLAEGTRADIALPALGTLEPPAAAGLPQSQGDMAPPVATMTSLPLETSAIPLAATRPTALERRLSGAAFITAGGSAGSMAGQPAADIRDVEAASQGIAQAGAQVTSPGSLAALLAGTSTLTASARVLPTRRLLLPKGAFVDCTLETAIDSTLPGLTTCVTATDTFSADGTVVLLERGTRLMGETRGQVQQASSRVFVLWTEARTPAGVVVPLDSPGADELGRAGLPGQVDRHFWARFGAAVLISTLDGAVQAAVQSSNHGTGTVIYNPTGAQEVMSDVLKSTVSIAPTVIKKNGDRIQILVARDVDFSHVYELRSAVAHR